MKDLATIPYRIISGLIDSLIGILLYQIVVFFVLSPSGIGEILNATLYGLLYVLVVLPVVFTVVSLLLITNFGGTIGKLATGTEIVDNNGNRISLWRAFFRNYIGYIVSSIFFLLGFLWVAIDKERRGWHDMIADTYVVVKRRSGLLTGVICLVLILAINVFLAAQSVRHVVKNMPIYKEALADIVEEFSKSVKKESPPPSSYNPYPSPLPRLFQTPSDTPSVYPDLY